MVTNLESLLHACEARPDVLGENVGINALAVDLDLISGSLGEKSIYGDSRNFFSITYPTATLMTVPRQILERITGMNPHSKGIYLLGTALGGGKSHVLAALYHLARLGGRAKESEARVFLGDINIPEIKIVVITQSSPAGGKQAPRTLWGEIAKQLGNPETMTEFDDALQAPPKENLRQLLQNKPILILIDELTNYLIRASAVTVGDSSLAVQTRVFLQDLEEVVDQLTNTAMVVSQLPEEFEPEHKATIQKITRGKKTDKAELESHAKREVGLTAQILLRKAEPITPVRDDEELVNILKRRIFKEIDQLAAQKTAEEYARYYASPGIRAALPVSASSNDFQQKLQKTYPFHPKFITLLRDKLGQAPKFMQTRGALLITILAVHRLHKTGGKEAILHPFHIDPNGPDIREELSKRVFDDVRIDNALVTEFVDSSGRRSRAGIIDDTFGGRLGTRLASSILLESVLVTHRGLGDPLVGAAETEILLDALVPGDDEVRARQALSDGILETSYHIEKTQEKLIFRGEVNLNRYIDEKAQHVPDHEVESAIRAKLEGQILKGSSVFSLKFWPTTPEEIEDRPKLQLVILLPLQPWWQDSEEPGLDIRRLFEKKNQAGEPRRNKNALVFLAPVASEQEKLFNSIRRVRAIESVRRDAMIIGSLTEEQKRKLEEDRAKAEGLSILRTGMTYRLMFYPSAEGGYHKPILQPKSLGITERDIGIDTDTWKAGDSRVLSIVQRRLQDEQKLREETPLSPSWISAHIFHTDTDHGKDSLKFKDLENVFYEDTSLPFLSPKEVVRRSIEEGIKSGALAIVSGRRLFTSLVSDTPIIHEDSEVVIHGSNRYQELLEEYHDRCGRPLGECTCRASTPQIKRKCHTCGRNEDECICEITRRDEILSNVPAIVAEELRKRDATVKEISLELTKAADVSLLLRIIPMFGGARASAELSEVYLSIDGRDATSKQNAVISGAPPGAFWPLLKNSAESLLSKIVSGNATGNARAHLLIHIKDALGPKAIEEVLKPLTIPGSEKIKTNFKMRPEVKQ